MTAATDLETADESLTGGGRRREVDVDRGRSVSYVEYGDPRGTPLVFLHGTPGSALLGGLFRERARQADTRVLAVDRPGYGRSASWPDRTLRDTGDFVVPVLDDAGVAAADVVGFSGGGPHALAVAATYPDCVRNLHVVGGVAPPSLRERTPTMQRTLSGLAERVPTLVRGLVRAQAWIADRRPPSFVVAQYTDGNGDTIPDDVAQVVSRDFVASVSTRRSGVVHELRMLNGSWASFLDDVDRPVRLWHGTRDTNVPIENAHNVRDRLPDARIEVFDDADHLGSLLRSRSPILEGDR